jgi:hypothetical protein
MTAPTLVEPQLGDVLEALVPDELRISPALAHRPVKAAGPRATFADSAPTNQQILDATKAFYAAHQPCVDTSTNNAKSVSSTQPGYVSQMNAYNWKSQALSQDEQNTTNSSIFGADGTGSGGLWGPTLDGTKADSLFTTIAVGVNADVQFFIGGAGGLGCAWDIAKREGPKGYGYATGELGLRVDLSINIQVAIFNQLPSQLNEDIFGLTATIGPVSFSAFFINLSSLTPLGYAIAIGLGFGGGATVFGGHIWNFG